VRGIRVADASVVPSAPVSAMNAPSMLIGYRAARYIREEIEAA
jgi:choline dehydrogenase